MRFLGLIAAAVCFLSAIEANRVAVCYYTNWAQYRYGDGVKFLPEDIDPNLCTHILYAFAKINLQTHKVENYEWNDDSMIQRVLALKTKNPELKVIISIGGWNHEKELRYSKMVQTSATRKICIDSMLTHLSSHKFDGVDIDWEYPGNRGSPAGDKELYTIFLQELKAALKEANVSYSLSASVGAGRPVMAKAYEIEKIKETLDWVNLMTYDLHGSWENVTGHSTAMTGVIPTVPDSLNAWLEGGMPPSQIALGIATYGRTFSLANTSNIGLGAPVYGPGLAGRYTRAQGFLSYYEVCFENWTSMTSWVASGAGAPYASKGNQWVGYETPESVVHKVKQLVNGHNLRGIAVWALDLDDFKGKFCNLGNYPIIKAAVAAMSGGYDNNNNDVIQFHSHNEKKKAAKHCYANPKWRQFRNSLQKWCEVECVLKAKSCPPWMCMCF